MRRPGGCGSGRFDRQPTPMRTRLTSRALLLCAMLAAARVSSFGAIAASHGAAPAGKPAPPPSAPTPGAEETPAVQGGLEFRAPVLAPRPAAGKGRLSLALEGNRRWCTYRDDRVARPPEMKNQRAGAPPPSHDEILTF